MPETVLKVEGLGVTLSGRRLLEDVSFEMREGECLALAGPTGSGKTLLLRALSGLVAHGGTVSYGYGYTKHDRRIAYVPRQHRFRNRSNLSSFYHQQRFNSFDSTDAPTATEELLHAGAARDRIDSTLAAFGIGHLRDEPLIRFSNGEHRRFQLARAMLKDPEWILFDNPMAGLDRQARDLFDGLLRDLMASGRHLIVATGTAEPSNAVTHVAWMEQGRLTEWMTRDAYMGRKHGTASAMAAVPDPDSLPPCISPHTEGSFEHAIRMEGLGIRYGDRWILDDIRWEVRRGERWSIEGPNGSGKSTLLSVVCGDNPQSHSQPLWLFDRRRGSGESIWDIKRRIGFLSPEMHQHVEKGLTGYEVVASGLFDTAGLYRKPGESQQAAVEAWMAVMGSLAFRDRAFDTLSDGEQRLLLIARTLVKNPPLLVFDEPCQGLDVSMVAWFRALTDALCRDRNRTLLYVSHYPGEVPSCVERTAKMDRGRLRVETRL